MFAKIFDTKKYGQVVLIKRQDEHGEPELRFYFQAEGYGVCEFAIGYPDTDEGASRVDQAFKQITPQEAIGLVSGWFDFVTKG